MLQMADAKHFGLWLIRLREAHGFKSTNSLAGAADVDQSQLSKIERGVMVPSDRVLEKLAPVLGVPLEDLQREALRDRLTPEEMQMAASLAAEGKGGHPAPDTMTEAYEIVDAALFKSDSPSGVTLVDEDRDAIARIVARRLEKK